MTNTIRDSALGFYYNVLRPTGAAVSAKIQEIRPKQDFRNAVKAGSEALLYTAEKTAVFAISIIQTTADAVRYLTKPAEPEEDFKEWQLVDPEGNPIFPEEE